MLKRNKRRLLESILFEFKGLEYKQMEEEEYVYDASSIDPDHVAAHLDAAIDDAGQMHDHVTDGELMHMCGLLAALEGVNADLDDVEAAHAWIQYVGVPPRQRNSGSSKRRSPVRKPKQAKQRQAKPKSMQKPKQARPRSPAGRNRAPPKVAQKKPMQKKPVAQKKPIKSPSPQRHPHPVPPIPSKQAKSPSPTKKQAPPKPTRAKSPARKQAKSPSPTRKQAPPKPTRTPSPTRRQQQQPPAAAPTRGRSRSPTRNQQQQQQPPRGGNTTIIDKSKNLTITPGGGSGRWQGGGGGGGGYNPAAPQQPQQPQQPIIIVTPNPTILPPPASTMSTSVLALADWQRDVNTLVGLVSSTDGSIDASKVNDIVYNRASLLYAQYLSNRFTGAQSSVDVLNAILAVREQ
jgi:hypothetical protein